MSQQIHALFDEELKKTTNQKIILKEEFFSLDYIPEVLLHRTKQLKDMVRYFKGIFNPHEVWISFRQTVVLTGGVGTGKTATAKRFGLEIEQLAIEKMPMLNFQYRHINCRRNRTIFSVLVALMKSLIPEFPSRGFASAELIRMLQNLLDQTNTYLLLTLDEIDFLTNDSEFANFLYSLTRLNDEHLQHSYRRISILLITKDSNSLFHALDGSVQSGLAKNIIHFPSYTPEELKDILRNRAELSLAPDTFCEEALDTIAKICDNTGDARYALELLWRAAKNVESNGTANLILPENVQDTTGAVFPVKPTILTDLSLPQKTLLLSISRVIERDTSKKFVTLAEVKTQFLLECEEYKLKIGRGNT
ncbi:MAG: Cdc6/Cdc18 family protein, partial [Candidatus Hodarchaeales archaeon]